MRGRPPSTPPDALTENLGIERLQNFCFLGKRQCADQVCRTLANELSRIRGESGAAWLDSDGQCECLEFFPDAPEEALR